MILFAVLGQYVKVLFSEHRLELHDIGGQRSSNSECLLTASSSFRETLEGRSGGSEVSLGKLWEEACKEQSVSKLPIRAVHLWRCFFKV